MSVEQLKGHGSLRKATTAKCEVEFILRRQHWHYDLELTNIDNPDQFAVGLLADVNWNLIGTLADGREIRCADLRCVRTTQSSILFPYRGVVIGTARPTEVQEALFPLTGTYGGSEISAQVGGWSLVVEEPSNGGAHTSWDAFALGRTLESSLLILKSPGATFTTCRAKARQVMSILSLAKGQGVTAHREFYSWESGEKLEIWKQRSGDYRGPGTLIPVDELAEYIESALPVWESWETEKQELVFRSIQYLNMSHTGVLDVRILHVVQALESLSCEWGEAQSLSEDLKELKSMLSDAWKQWRVELDRDPDGFWKGRISQLFKWAKLRLQIEELFKSRNISIPRIDLDLGVLKDARDAVAHSGMLPEYIGEDKRLALQTLKSCQFGLQLLLLAELGYRGTVLDSRGAWLERKRIEDYCEA